MKRLKCELEEWLPERFPGSEVSLELGPPGTGLSGILAWRGFKRLEPFERQRLLRHAIATRFSHEDQLGISIIITLTPAEYSVYREPQMA